MTTIDLEDVKIKLYERLKPSGWADVLKTFILSSDFDNILEELLRQSKDSKRFTPQIKYLFRAFEECSYNTLKVIILGQDPYPYLNVADGIAFSCSIDNRIQPSLKYIGQEIKRTVYPEQEWVIPTDLKCWSNQGVLMLNSALTTTVNKIGVHYKLWQPFLTFLFDHFTFNGNDYVYAFLGRKAEDWAISVPTTCYKFIVTHPAAAAHNKSEIWESKNLFNEINNALVSLNKESIVW
jgi:uracil-DNA glycosylase